MRMGLSGCKDTGKICPRGNWKGQVGLGTVRSRYDKLGSHRLGAKNDNGDVNRG